MRQKTDSPRRRYPLIALLLFSITLGVPTSLIAQSCCDPADAAMCEADGGVYNYLTCTCRNMTPIMISLSKNGIRLTNVGGGVRFDLNGDGSAEHIAWTAAGTDDGFLVLDRNHNGVIDDGRELFSDIAPQPPSQF